MRLLSHPFCCFLERSIDRLTEDSVYAKGKECRRRKVDQLFLRFEPERQRITRFY